jgi:thymidylate kinase
VVELLAPGDLGLGDGPVDVLFERSLRLDGSELVRRPAPHHALLILARRVVRGGRSLSNKRRARVAALLAADPQAFERAGREARSWGLASALAALKAAYELGTPIARGRRMRAIAEERAACGDHPLLAAAKGWRAVVRRPPRRRSFTVALSGLDGAGKSTQAQALRDALDRLGYRADVQWSSLIAYPGFLTHFRRVANQILGVLEPFGRRTDAPLPKDTMSRRSRRPPDAAKRLRLRSPLVAFLWTSMVALRNGIEHRRVTRPNIRRGRVVICDRYELDSRVALRYDYGEDRRFGFQGGLIHLVSPPADRAFLLAVSPETASRRKADYGLEQNALRAKLYDEEAARLGIRRVDGERPPGAVLTELLTEVWQALRARERHRGLRRRERPATEDVE